MQTLDLIKMFGWLEAIFGAKNKEWEKKRNKLAYLVGMCYMLLNTFIIGSAPCFFPKFSAIVTCVLFTIRLHQFYQKNWHLYLFDFCYFANILLVYTILFSDDLNRELLLQISMGFTICLLPSVCIYGNSLVPHNLEIFTNCFVHLNHSITLLVINYNECYRIDCNFQDMMVNCMKVFAAYSSIYIPLMFVVLKGYWTRNNVPNLYIYWLDNNERLGRIFRGKPAWIGGLAFLFVQTFSFVIGISVSYISCLYENFFLMLVLSQVFYALHRGGNYYFEYLPKKLSKTS